MENEYVKEVDLENSLFHFHPKKFYDEVVEKGLVSRIGDNSKGIEETKKIFFSKGIDGVLKCWDIWIKWEMKHAFNGDDKYDLFLNDEEKNRMKEYWHTNFPLNANYDEIKSFFQTFPHEYKEKFYDKIIPKKIENQNYFILDIKDGEESYSNDIDENKKKLKNEFDKIDSNNYPEILTMLDKTNGTRALYGSFSRNDVIMDDWNMHTKPNVSIDKEKITRVSTADGRTDILSILTELYEVRKKMPNHEQLYNQFDVLNDFMSYVQNKNLKRGDTMNEENLKKVSADNLPNLDEQKVEKTVAEQLEELKTMRAELVESTKSLEEASTYQNKPSKQQEKGRQYVMKKPNKPNNYGFANKLILALLVGFASGVMATATYIFLNLGKFTFTF